MRLDQMQEQERAAWIAGDYDKAGYLAAVIDAAQENETARAKLWQVADEAGDALRDAVIALGLDRRPA